jgi:hypothetical protein
MLIPFIVRQKLRVMCYDFLYDRMLRAYSRILRTVPCKIIRTKQRRHEQPQNAEILVRRNQRPHRNRMKMQNALQQPAGEESESSTMRAQ